MADRKMKLLPPGTKVTRCTHNVNGCKLAFQTEVGDLYNRHRFACTFNPERRHGLKDINVREPNFHASPLEIDLAVDDENFPVVCRNPNTIDVLTPPYDPLDSTTYHPYSTAAFANGNTQPIPARYATVEVLEALEARVQKLESRSRYSNQIMIDTSNSNRVTQYALLQSVDKLVRRVEALENQVVVSGNNQIGPVEDDADCRALPITPVSAGPRANMPDPFNRRDDDDNFLFDGSSDDVEEPFALGV